MGGSSVQTANNVTGETIDGTGSNITIASGVTAFVNGSDKIGVQGSDSTITIKSSNSVAGTGFISETSGESGNVINVDTYGETVFASDATINVAAGGFVAVAGADDLINMMSNSGSWAYVSGRCNSAPENLPRLASRLITGPVLLRCDRRESECKMSNGMTKNAPVLVVQDDPPNDGCLMVGLGMT